MTDYAQIVSIPCSRLFEMRGVYLGSNHLKYLRLLFHSYDREREREREDFSPPPRDTGSCAVTSVELTQGDVDSRTRNGGKEGNGVKMGAREGKREKESRKAFNKSNKKAHK